MGYSNQITANDSSAQALGVVVISARVTVSNMTTGATPPDAYVLGVNDGSTPSPADVVAGGMKIVAGGEPLVLEDPHYVDLSTYWVATASGTADVRVIE